MWGRNSCHDLIRNPRLSIFTYRLLSAKVCQSPVGLTFNLLGLSQYVSLNRYLRSGLNYSYSNSSRFRITTDPIHWPKFPPSGGNSWSLLMYSEQFARAKNVWNLHISCFCHHDRHEGILYFPKPADNGVLQRRVLLSLLHILLQRKHLKWLPFIYKYNELPVMRRFLGSGNLQQPGCQLHRSVLFCVGKLSQTFIWNSKV